MKTLKLKIGIALLGSVLLTMNSFAQQHVIMSMKNITATANTIEYDLYIVNDGNTRLKLSACSYGVNFNPEILNGGTLTYDYMNESRSEDLSGLTPFAKNAKQEEALAQVRLTTVPCGYENAPELKAEVPFRVGRFRIENSSDWTKNSRAAFNFQEVLKIGLTTTQIVGYVDNSSKLIALTPGLGTVSTSIEESPILNPTSNQTLSIASSASSAEQKGRSMLSEKGGHKLYPNPVQGELHLDLNMANATSVRIDICDMSGRLLKQVLTRVTEGIQTIDLNTEEFPAGIYSVRVMEGEVVHFTGKFTKQ